MIDTTETQAEEYATEQPITFPEETLQEQPLPKIHPREKVEHPEIEPHIPEEYITDARNTLQAKYATVSEKMGGIEGPDIPDSVVKELALKNYQKDQLLEKQKKEAEPYTEELQEDREPVKVEDIKTFVGGDTPEVTRVVPEDELPAVVKEQDIDLSPIIQTPNKSYVTSFDELKQRHPEGSIELIGGRVWVRELELTTGKYKKQPSMSYVFLPPLRKVTPHAYEAAVPEYDYDEGKLAKFLSNFGPYSIEDQLFTQASVNEDINTDPDLTDFSQKKVESYLQGFEQEDLTKINMLEEKAFTWARKKGIDVDTRLGRAEAIQKYIIAGVSPLDGTYEGLAYMHKGKPISGKEEGLTKEFDQHGKLVGGIAFEAQEHYKVALAASHQFFKILAIRQNYLDYVLHKEGYEREGMGSSVYQPSTRRRVAGPVIQAGTQGLKYFLEHGLPLLARTYELTGPLAYWGKDKDKDEVKDLKIGWAPIEGIYHSLTKFGQAFIDDPKTGKTPWKGLKEGFSYFDKYVGVTRKPTGTLFGYGEPVVDKETGKVVYDSPISKYVDILTKDVFPDYGTFEFPFGAYKTPIAELEDRLGVSWEGKKLFGMFDLDRDLTLGTIDIRGIQPLTTLEGLTAKGGAIVGTVFGGIRLPFIVGGRVHSSTQAKRIIKDLEYYKKTGIEKGTLVPDSRIGGGIFDVAKYPFAISRGAKALAVQEAKYPFTNMSNDFVFGLGMKSVENMVISMNQIQQKYGGDTFDVTSEGARMFYELLGGVGFIMAKDWGKSRIAAFVDIIVPSLQKQGHISKKVADGIVTGLGKFWTDLPVPSSAGQRDIYKSLSQKFDSNEVWSVHQKDELAKAVIWMDKVLKKYDPQGKLGNPSVGLIMSNTYLHNLSFAMEQKAAEVGGKGRFFRKADPTFAKGVEDLKELVIKREAALLDTLQVWRKQAIKQGISSKEADDIQELIINSYIDSERLIKLGAAKEGKKIRDFIGQYKNLVVETDYTALSKLAQELERKQIKGTATADDLKKVVENVTFIDMQKKAVENFFLKQHFLKASNITTIDEFGTQFYTILSRRNYKELYKTFSGKGGAYSKIPGYENGTLTAVSNEFIISSINKIKEIKQKQQAIGIKTGKEKGEIGTIALEDSLEKLVVSGIENWAVKNKINNFESLYKRLEDSKIFNEKQLEALLKSGDYTTAREVLAQAWRDNPASVAMGTGLEGLAALETPLKKIISFRQGLDKKINTLFEVGARDETIAYIDLYKTVQNSIKNIKGTQDLKGFTEVENLYAKYMSIYSDIAVLPLTRIRKGTMLYPKSPKDMVLQWFTNFEKGADAKVKYDIFNKMFPEKTVRLGADGKLEEVKNIYRPLAIRKIQQAYESRILQNRDTKPITKELLLEIQARDKDFFTRGLGQEFISSAGTKGDKYLEAGLTFIDKANTAITGKIKENLVNYGKFESNAKYLNEKLKINTQAELKKLGFLELEGILGNTQSLDAQKKLINFIFNSKDYKGGNDKNITKLMKYFTSDKIAKTVQEKKDNIIALQNIVFDVIYQQVLSGNLSKRVFTGSDAKIMEKFIETAGPNTGALLTTLVMNKQTLKKLYDTPLPGEKQGFMATRHVEDLEDLASALTIITSRGRVNIPSGLSGSITDLGILSRFFAIARGVVSVRFIAAEMTMRAWKDHNTAIMKNLVTDKHAGRIVKKMIVDGKYITPKEQRVLWKYTIRVVANEGDYDLADKLERQYKSGQLFINTFLAPGSEEFKKVNKRIFGSEEGLRLAGPDEYEEFKKKLKKQQLLN